MPERIANLKEDLDEKSKKNIDTYLFRMLYLPDGHLRNNYKMSTVYLDSLNTKEEKIFFKMFCDELPKYKIDYFHTIDAYNPDTYLFHHGLRFASDKIKEYIKNKDFIDGGAWIGDGVMVLTRFYNPKKVYAFELSKVNYEMSKAVMEINKIPKEKYCLIPMGLNDKKETILYRDGGTQGTSALTKGNDEANMTDIDSFVFENNINPGFIKADIEGFGLRGLKGMEKTIKQFRPVLSLAIYHNPEEFFEMKPLLDQIVKDKNYKITVDRYNVIIGELTEMVIFAYPAELGE